MRLRLSGAGARATPVMGTARLWNSLTDEKADDAMNSLVAEAHPPAATSPGVTEIAGLEPMRTLKSRWPVVIAGALTVLMIVGLGRELLGSGLKGLQHATPSNPLYYVAFAVFYMAAPVADFIIFRRLWRIPIGGLAALIKKRIANEVAFTYSGDAYFYAWARANAPMVAAPFGAVKDVSILSAIAGNVMTLITIGLAMPYVGALLPPAYLRTLSWSIVIVFCMSLPFLIFSKRVFSLTWTALVWIFSIHSLRLVTTSVVTAFAWHVALPDVPIGTWLFLLAVRMLVGRLPVVPNKDLFFANLVFLLRAHDTALTELTAFTAALTLLVNVVLMGLFSIGSLARKKIT